jgi:parvulin-like peptidyl-prolyl isomerase
MLRSRLGLLLGLLSFWFCCGRGDVVAGTKSSDARFEKVMLTVNGRPFTRSYVILRLGKSLRRLTEIRRRRKETGAWTLDQEEIFVNNVTELHRRLYRELIFNEILRTAAQPFIKLGFGVSDREVERRLKLRVEKAGGPVRMAEEQGLSMAELKDVVRDELLADAYRRNLRHTAGRPTPQEIRDFFRENSEMFRRPESIRARVIVIKRFLIDPDGGPDSERLSAEKRATELMAKIKGGADFAKTAERFSEDPISAASGGLLGKASRKNLVVRGDLDLELEKMLFKCQAGPAQGPFKGGQGFYIVKVEARFAEGVPPLPEVEKVVLHECFRKRVRRIEEDLFRRYFSKLLVLDSRGCKVPIEHIWPKDPARARPRIRHFKEWVPPNLTPGS